MPAKLIYTNIKNYIEDFNYKLLSTEYTSNKEKLELQCPNKHIFNMSFHVFKDKGNRCFECSGKKRNILNVVKNYIEDFNYKLLSTSYIKALDKLKLLCPKGHIFEMRYNDFQQGHRCPECSLVLGWSKAEKEIVEYVKSIYSGNIIENDRTVCKNYWSGKNLELDIYLPEIQKAIEYNGRHWHSFEQKQWYDEMKKKQCIKKGINLLVIQEQDWLDNKMYQLNKINKLVGV